VDYTAHNPLPEYLATAYLHQPFDAIFDCIGDQELFSHSPAYMKPSGQLISIVGGKSEGVVPFVKNKLVPSFLGGTPRTYKILGLLPNGPYAREVATWPEKGLAKEVPIDGEFTFDQVVEVSRHGLAYQEPGLPRALTLLSAGIREARHKTSPGEDNHQVLIIY
jgi:hypothetical protein